MIRNWLRVLVWPIVSAALLAGPAGALAATGQTPVTVSTEAAEIVYWPATASPPAPAPRRLRAPPGIDEPGAAGWDLLNTGWSKEKKLKWLNVGILGGMMAYGLVYWGYGETSPQFVDEGWFEHDSIHGGADKLGHAISTYYAVQAFSSVYQRWGYDRHRANIYGSLSAETTFFMIEVGDAFSRNGFCVQDLVADTFGACVGFLRREYPGFEKRVDFRVEYWPSYAVTSGDDKDLVSDYSGYKYLVALKGSGFDLTSSSWLQYFELQGGYYTRGYQNGDEDHYGDPHRVLYGALAVNLTHIFDKHNWNKTASFLRYYQVPYTYLPVEYNLDE